MQSSKRAEPISRRRFLCAPAHRTHAHSLLPKFASGRTWRNLYGFLPVSRVTVFSSGLPVHPSGSFASYPHSIPD
jgi:hypothetical protein